MLDEDRIRVMTKLAVFEKEEGKQTELASHYYKNDYVSYHMIWTAIASTIAYFLILALFICYRADYYVNNIHQLKMSSIARVVVISFLLFILFFQLIAWFLYRRRFVAAQQKLKQYCDELHELEKIYNKEYHRMEKMAKNDQDEQNMKAGGTITHDIFTGI